MNADKDSIVQLTLFFERVRYVVEEGELAEQIRADMVRRCKNFLQMCGKRAEMEGWAEQLLKTGRYYDVVPETEEERSSSSSSSSSSSYSSSESSSEAPPKRGRKRHAHLVKSVRRVSQRGIDSDGESC